MFALLGENLSLNGKLFSDISIILLLVELLGNFEFTAYKVLYVS